MIVDALQIVEALLFASDSPLPARKIKEILPDIGGEGDVKKLLRELEEKYDKSNSSIQIIQLAGGYQMVTRETYASWVSQLYKARAQSRLTRKGLETLAIIAYRQPITKQEIEHIRGVSADGVVRTLIERNLITVKGREKAPGNPLLYGTTKYFLEYFGLNDISDLPKLKEIDELLKGDSKFLESLDQVALEQLMPEALGLNSMTDEEDGGGEEDKADAAQDEPPAENAQDNDADEGDKEEEERRDPSE